jgi:hypothetical protein
MQHFRIQGLPAEPFAPLFDMPDWALEKHGAVRRIADKAVIRAGSVSPTPRRATS